MGIAEEGARTREPTGRGNAVATALDGGGRTVRTFIEGCAAVREPEDVRRCSRRGRACRPGIDHVDAALREVPGTPRPQSVEHALYMIVVDWLNNMTMCGGLKRFESALAKARPGGTKQILR